MRKLLFFIYALLAILICSGTIFTSCTDLNNTDEEYLVILEDVDINTASGNLNVDRCKTLILTSKVKGHGLLQYEWSLGGNVVSKEKDFAFVSLSTGDVEVTLNVKQKDILKSEKVTIKVKKESKQYSAESVKVLEYLPAPGQFGNTLPMYNEGDTQETMNKKAESMLEEKGLVSLGAYGGYIIVGFDHTIVNVPNKKDFKVAGNAFYANSNPRPNAPKEGGSCEPGIIEVAYDRNGNGKPDENEWCEIAGSEYYKPTTIKNYTITYYKPNEKKIATPDNSISATDTTYCKWTDNQGKSGYIFKSSFHKQAYYPQWAADKITFKGTLLPNNAIDESHKGTYWVLYAYPWGYADNAPNNNDLSNIDIDWAVDRQGNKVHLPGIDFVKVYTGVQQYAGWLGDTSTEVSYFEDLHLSLK